MVFIKDPPDERWNCRFVLTPPSPVHCVSAAGGLVVAAGRSLHMLRPGSQRVVSRELPPDLEVVAVAAEPWSPYRLAISSPKSVEIYTGHRPHEPICTATGSDGDLGATHLAWGRVDGKSTLFLRRQSGMILQLDLEARLSGALDMPKVSAIAADENGVLALINLRPEKPEDWGEAWVLPVGAKRFGARWIDCGPDDGKTTWTIGLAVHGRAVAYWENPASDEYTGNAEVSWQEECEDEFRSFGQAPGVFDGPLAFQNERAIFAAYNCVGRVEFRRWVRDGAFTRIGVVGLDDQWGGDPAWVTGLAWDEHRRTLWAASPELGLIALTPPG